MIAGMIDKRKEKDNNILLILGARTETENQFSNIFKNFHNFEDYGIITISNRDKESDYKKFKKHIFIFSQELLKIHIKKGRNGKFEFKDDFKRKYEPLFDKKHIDIYFDEIHKGGTTEKAREEVITTFINDKFKNRFVCNGYSNLC